MSFIRDELTSLNELRNSVKRKLEQLHFESRNEGAPRVEVVDVAAASKTPQSDSRTLWMMVLPPAVLFIVLGFFLVLDARPLRRPAATRDHRPAVNLRGRSILHPPIFTTPASPSTVIR